MSAGSETQRRWGGRRRPRRKREAGLSGLLAAPALILIGVFFVVPVLLIFWMSISQPPGGLSHYAKFFSSEGYLKATGNTFLISGAVLALCTVLGIPYAWIMATASRRLRSILFLLLLIPLWTSMLVRSYSWLIILNPYGIINTLLLDSGLIEEPLELVRNMTGVLIGMTHILLPLYVLPVYDGFSKYDQRLSFASRSLGSSPLSTFFRITLPVTLPGIIAGSVLVFVVAMGFYITPALLGGAGQTMISQLIADQFSKTLDWGLGSAMAAILLGSTLILLALAFLVMKVTTRTGLRIASGQGVLVEEAEEQE